MQKSLIDLENPLAVISELQAWIEMSNRVGFPPFESLPCHYP